MAVKRYSGTTWVTEAGGVPGLPSGMISPFAGSTAPSGWLLSDGAAVSRTTYADLFTAIGTAYGVGDGSTTFNLPDLRGRVIAALDNMGGTDASRLNLANTLGTTAGTQTHTLTTAEMPVHTHVQDAHTHIQNQHTHVQDAHTHTQNAHSHGFPADLKGTYNGVNQDVNYSGGGAYLTNRNATNNATATNQNATATNQNTTPTNQNATATNQNAGSGGAHNNMQPTILMNYIIKV